MTIWTRFLRDTNSSVLMPTYDPRKQYLEFDNIRLVIEDGELAGWYCQGGAE